MIATFADAGTEDIFNGADTAAARRTCPASLWSVARRKLFQLNAAHDLRDLRSPPGNRLERLEGDRWGQHSIRVNSQYRLCFSWTVEDATNVEITDYH